MSPRTGRPGLRHRACALAVTVAASATVAAAAEPEFPLGAWARPGRPVVLRVSGAARVRGGGSPWALPVGERGDEFVLQLPRADLTLHEVEIDEDGAIRRTQIALRALPEVGPVTAAFTAASGTGDVPLPRTGLPTVREAWLLFDDVRDPPDGLAPAERRALDAWRASPRPGAELAPFEPLTWRPGPEAFRAAAASAARAPRLPRDVALVLLLAAVAEISLLLLTTQRRTGVRAAWLAGPPLAALVWIVAGGRLPGAVRAVTLRLEAPGRTLWIVRFDAPRGGEVSFRVPDGASLPALLRYDGDDRSAADASSGRDVVLPIPAGQSRVVAWSVPGAAEPAGAGDPPAPGTGVDAWEWLGVRPLGPCGATGDPFAARTGFRPVEGTALAVAPLPSTRK